MRIDAYNQIQSLYQTQKVKTVQKPKATGSVQSDKLQISSFGKDLQVAKAALGSTPDIREDVVAPIKAQVQNGTYNVDAESFADKLLAKYQQMI